MMYEVYTKTRNIHRRVEFYLMTWSAPRRAHPYGERQSILFTGRYSNFLLLDCKYVQQLADQEAQIEVRARLFKNGERPISIHAAKQNIKFERLAKCFLT